MYLTQIYSKVNEFWRSDKYCDLTIEVQEKSFKCHRLLLAASSEYFDIMLGGTFLEGKTNNVVLKEQDIDAVSFKQVLYHIYDGSVVLTKYNVFGTLRASRFLLMAGLEEECIAFIQNNLPVCEMLEVFKYANLINEKSLVECTSRYIMEYFNEFDHDRFFLELSFEDLCTLIENRLYLSRENERPFVNAIYLWVNYACDTRVGEFKEMKKKYWPEESAKSELLKLVQEISRLPNVSDDSAESYEPVDWAFLDIFIKPKSDLHLYFFTQDETKVYSFDRKMFRGKISCSIPHIVGNLSVVGVGDYMYCLSSYIYGPVFQACPSVDFTYESQANRRLQSPPTTVDDYSIICNIQNRIYLNNGGEFLGTELQQPQPYECKLIYVYDIDVDKWFRGPDPEVNPSCSTIVTYNDVLYLVECGGRVQALDDRISKWQELNKAGDCDCDNLAFRTTRSCVHDGKIYKCTLSKYPFSEACRYDLTASKWEKTTPMSGIENPVKLLSYENLLWAVGESRGGRAIVETYNPRLNEWRPLSMPNLFDETLDYEAVKEGVVFKLI